MSRHTLRYGMVRADVAAELLASLDNPSIEDQASVQAAWALEIERRARRVLELPREQRARVAEEVLSSLEEPSEDVAEAWVETLKRRSAEAAEGRVRTVEWEHARDEVTRELAAPTRSGSTSEKPVSAIPSSPTSISRYS